LGVIVSHDTTAVTQRLQQFKDACRRASIKLTHQRLVIFEAVARATDHPDAEAVYREVRKQIPTVSLDTVYRTLWTLHDLGLVTTVGLPRERLRFDGNMAPHHHFVCMRCGATEDFYHDPFDRLALPDDVRTLGQVQRVQVEVRGICQRCAQQDSPDSPGRNQT